MFIAIVFTASRVRVVAVNGPKATFSLDRYDPNAAALFILFSLVKEMKQHIYYCSD